MITVLSDTFGCVTTHLNKKPPPLMLATININKGHVYTGPDIFLPRKKTYTVTIHFAFNGTGVTWRIFERLSVKFGTWEKRENFFDQHDFSFVRTRVNKRIVQRFAQIKLLRPEMYLCFCLVSRLDPYWHQFNRISTDPCKKAVKEQNSFLHKTPI